MTIFIDLKKDCNESKFIIFKVSAGLKSFKDLEKMLKTREGQSLSERIAKSHEEHALTEQERIFDQEKMRANF